MDYITFNEQPTEMVVGLVAPFGANKGIVVQALEAEVRLYNYRVETVKISQIIEDIKGKASKPGAVSRVSYLMDKGDELRSESGNDAILAMLAVAQIQKRRKDVNDRRVIWLIDSVKHSAEVLELRKIYSSGFHLLAVHVDKERRLDDFIRLKDEPSRADVEALIARDERENDEHGQQTEKVFQYADYFLHYNGSVDKVNNSVERVMGLLFGNPYINSTFNEYAMYLAYVAGMRSGDLSRQVGAVVANQERKEILSLGANECPAFGGGQYWPVYDKQHEKVVEVAGGKDFMRGEDFNHCERLRLYEDVCARLGLKPDPDNLRKLAESKLADITEYGRMVHAEMEAILGCARRGIPTIGATLFCTTFPCHNCAKHIIASGILRVLYIEPYPKSKACSMHPDALSLNLGAQDRVVFEPYVGVGPRRYVDLFSMDLGVGAPIKRKDQVTGKTLVFDKRKAIPRLRMHPGGYTEIEKLVVSMLNVYFEEG